MIFLVWMQTIIILLVCIYGVHCQVFITLFFLVTDYKNEKTPTVTLIRLRK